MKRKYYRLVVMAPYNGVTENFLELLAQEALRLTKMISAKEGIVVVKTEKVDICKMANNKNTL